MRLLRRTGSFLLSVALVAVTIPANVGSGGVFGAETVTASAAEVKTPQQIVDEITWGVNLPDFFIADDGVYGVSGTTEGYCGNYLEYPIGMEIWSWDGSYNWLSYNEMKHNEPIDVEVDLPSYSSDTVQDWIGGLFRIGAVTDSSDKSFSVKLSECRIVKSNGTEVRLDTLNQTYTVDSFSAVNSYGNADCILDIDYSSLPAPSSELSNGTFKATIEFEGIPILTGEEKANFFFEHFRTEADQYELTDLYLDQGINAVRLPVSWSPFTNDETFEIDPEWLALVKTEVDYLIDNDVYVILDTHNDYMETSYVGDHWETNWRNAAYKDYVDSRFAAVWKQIAEYFKDYSDKLIFEPLNEMPGFSDTDCTRLNELNKIFTDTIRSTGGNNATRLLCLAVAHYNDVDYLERLTLPEDDNIVVTVHTYRIMEDFGPTVNTSNSYYKPATDAFFEKIKKFTETTGVPVIVGEVGFLTPKNDSVQAPKAQYLFEKAVEYKIPTLWWEDCLLSSPATSLYNAVSKEWDRPLTLAAIKNAVGIESISTAMNIVADSAKLNINIYIQIAEDKDINDYTVLFDGTEQSLTSTDNGYMFTLSVAAKNMSDEYELIVNKGNTRIEKKQISVKKYLNSLIADETWGKAAEAMLSYGAAAQNYFDYNTENLALPNVDWGLAITLWNGSYNSLVDISTHDNQADISLTFPKFNNDVQSWVNGLFNMAFLTKDENYTVEVTLSNSKIVTGNGEIISLSGMDGAYTLYKKNSSDTYGGITNLYFDLTSADLPTPGTTLDGATFSSTLTVKNIYKNTNAFDEEIPDWSLSMTWWNGNYSQPIDYGSHDKTITVSNTFPAYKGSVQSWVGGLFNMAVNVRNENYTVELELSNSKIVKANGDIISLTDMNGSYKLYKKNSNDTYNGITNLYFDLTNAGLPEPSTELDGAKFYTTITINKIYDVNDEASSATFDNAGLNTALEEMNAPVRYQGMTLTFNSDTTMTMLFSAATTEDVDKVKTYIQENVALDGNTEIVERGNYIGVVKKNIPIKQLETNYSLKIGDYITTVNATQYIGNVIEKNDNVYLSTLCRTLYTYYETVKNIA